MRGLSEMRSIVLSAEQRNSFLVNGHLHLEQCICSAFLDTVQLLLEEWVDRTISNWKVRGVIAENFSRCNFDTRLYTAWLASNKVYLSPNESLSELNIAGELLRDKFLAISTQLLGSDNTAPLEGSFFRAKLPEHDFSSIPWHQDAQCFDPITDADFVTLWIPLVDIGESNSCLEIADIDLDRGTYEPCYPEGAPYVGMQAFDIDKLVNKRKMLMRRGDILCIHKYLPHRSLGNETDKIRWSLDIRYQSV
jgi:ectoine hydroxylase-related dioxygenase (phytanoyl-CoA dioxygenase family)